MFEDHQYYMSCVLHFMQQPSSFFFACTPSPSMGFPTESFSRFLCALLSPLIGVHADIMHFLYFYTKGEKNRAKKTANLTSSVGLNWGFLNSSCIASKWAHIETVVLTIFSCSLSFNVLHKKLPNHPEFKCSAIRTRYPWVNSKQLGNWINI